jgi:D123
MEDVVALFAAVDFSKWYSAIERHTFRSTEVATTLDECRALLALNRSHRRLKATEDGPFAVPAPLAELEQRLDAVLAREFSGCAFAKLGDRSAKDAASSWSRVEPLYRSRTLPRDDAGSPSEASNSHLQALVWANANAQRVTSGREILELFCESERIEDELELKLEHVSTPAAVPVLLREWVDGVDPAFEFRAFVVRDELTCMSQMSSMEVYLHYPHVVARREELAASARTFFASDLRDALRTVTASTAGRRYVIDLYFDALNDRWLVVELNPWETSALGHLFSFGTDDGVLDSGPFELRLREQTRSSDVAAIQNADWRRTLAASPDEYD